MPITVGNSEPTQFTIGDAVSWVRREVSYPAPDWQLQYGFFGPSRFSVTSSQNNTTTDHLIALPTKRETINPGAYTWTVRAILASDATMKITLGSGLIIALPNLADADTELDDALDRLERVETSYSGLIGKQFSSTSVEGVSYTLANIDQLNTARMSARREVARIKRDRNALFGLNGSGTFITRFRC